MPKTNLIFTTTGGPYTPNYPHLIGPDTSYDIYLVDYGDGPAVEMDGLSYYTRIKGHKWEVAYHLLTEYAISEKYEYYFFPDMDLKITQNMAEMIFEIANRFDLSLCQPSLSADSTSSWHVTKTDLSSGPGRYTNFVEVMCPVFSKKALNLCLHTFLHSQSGWGLDFWWAKILMTSKLKLGVIDTVVVDHLHPRQSGNWVLPNGKTPQRELNEIVQENSLKTAVRTFGRLR